MGLLFPVRGERRLLSVCMGRGEQRGERRRKAVAEERRASRGWAGVYKERKSLVRGCIGEESRLADNMRGALKLSGLNTRRHKPPAANRPIPNALFPSFPVDNSPDPAPPPCPTASLNRAGRRPQPLAPAYLPFPYILKGTHLCVCAVAHEPRSRAHLRADTYTASYVSIT